jgi:hypothetical protein
MLASRPEEPSAKISEPGRPLCAAPFEFAAKAYAFAAPSGTSAGGGATAAFRIHPDCQSEWMWMAARWQASS